MSRFPSLAPFALAAASALAAVGPVACFQSLDDFQVAGASTATGFGATGPTSSTTSSNGGGGNGGAGGSTTDVTTTSTAETTSTLVSTTSTGVVETCPAPATCEPQLAGFSSAPALFIVKDTSASPPECPTEFPTKGASTFSGTFSAPAVSCNPCTCEQTCGVIGEVKGFETGCGTETGVVLAAGAAGCVQNVAIPPNTAALQGAAPAGGACTPQGGGVKAAPPVAWQKTWTRCDLPSPNALCADGATCVPPPPNDPDARLCVIPDDNTTCPATGRFTVPHFVYGNAKDERSCSACTCAGGLCTASVAPFAAGTNCASGGGAATPLNGTCQPATLSGTVDLEVTLTPTTPCQAGGGVATGIALPDETTRVTLCCTN